MAKRANLKRHDRNVHLVLREKMSDGDYVSVVTYGAAEMAEVFTADECRALARGFTVTRGGCTWVDAIESALARGL